MKYLGFYIDSWIARTSLFFQGILALAPFILMFGILIYNVFLAYFRQDDYFFIPLFEYRGYVDAQIWLFKNWMGRPISSAITMLPGFSDDAFVRRIILQVTLIVPIATYFAAFFYLGQSTRKLTHRIGISIVCTVVLYSLFSDFSSSVYWSSAVHTYQTSVSFMFLGFVLSLNDDKEPLSFKSTICYLISAGCVQLSALFVLILPIMSIWVAHKDNVNVLLKYKFLLLYLLLILWSAFIIFVPGGRQASEATLNFANGFKWFSLKGTEVFATSLIILLGISFLFRKGLPKNVIPILALNGSLLSLFYAYGFLSDLYMQPRVVDYYSALFFVLNLSILTWGVDWFKIPSKFIILIGILGYLYIFDSQWHKLIGLQLSGKNQEFYQARIFDEKSIRRINTSDHSKAYCPSNPQDTETHKLNLVTPWLKKTYAGYWNIEFVCK